MIYQLHPFLIKLSNFTRGQCKDCGADVIIKQILTNPHKNNRNSRKEIQCGFELLESLQTASGDWIKLVYLVDRQRTRLKIYFSALSRAVESKILLSNESVLVQLYSWISCSSMNLKRLNNNFQTCRTACYLCSRGRKIKLRLFKLGSCILVKTWCGRKAKKKLDLTHFCNNDSKIEARRFWPPKAATGHAAFRLNYPIESFAPSLVHCQ